MILWHRFLTNHGPKDTESVSGPYQCLELIDMITRLPIVPTITRQLEKMKGSGRSNKPRTKDTWKGRKLLRRQQETLAEVQRMKRNLGGGSEDETGDKKLSSI
uniref:Uncharacterized protein n=1 Tax=Timema tahoe TaxID=61484 RepID=A0A7R9IEL0_9NEOP|nr:unnamed protein product [Timema tahoe]